MTIPGAASVGEIDLTQSPIDMLASQASSSCVVGGSPSAPFAVSGVVCSVVSSGVQLQVPFTYTLTASGPFSVQLQASSASMGTGYNDFTSANSIANGEVLFGDSSSQAAASTSLNTATSNSAITAGSLTWTGVIPTAGASGNGGVFAAYVNVDTIITP